MSSCASKLSSRLDYISRPNDLASFIAGLCLFPDTFTKFATPASLVSPEKMESSTLSAPQKSAPFSCESVNEILRQ